MSPGNTSGKNEQLIPVRSEYDELIEEIRCLRDTLIHLTALRDDLVLHICPALQALYEEKLGCIEREILAAEMYIREKRRILEILRSQLNRQEEISYQDAEKTAAEERRQFEQELDKKSKAAEESEHRWHKSRWADYEDRRESKSDSHTEDEFDDAFRKDTTYEDEFDENNQDNERVNRKSSIARKIKSLYRKIIKKLHPDMNPDITEHEKDLFLKAQRAYEAGDYEALKQVWDELEGLENPEEKYADNPKDIKKVKELILKMRRLIEALQIEIANIRGEFPYTMKELLEDERRLLEKQEELRKKLQDIRDADAYLAEYLEKVKEEIQKSQTN